MTSTECYDLIRRGVDIEVPGLEVYYDKVVLELRGSCVICVTFYGAEVRCYVLPLIRIQCCIHSVNRIRMEFGFCFLELYDTTGAKVKSV